MTNVLVDLRAELAALLSAGGLVAYDHIPARVNPPVAVIAAGEPYVSETFEHKTFKSDYQIRMEVTLIAGQATNETVTDELDDLICKTLIALNGAWSAEVSQPFQMEVNGALYLATRVQISTTINL